MPNTLRGTNPPAVLLTILSAVLAALSIWQAEHQRQPALFVLAGLFVLCAILIPQALIMANQWE